MLTSGLQSAQGIFAAADMAAPLPVQLREFMARAQGARAVLTWSTASELNNVGFAIEVSLDGQVFQQVGFVAGQGSSTSSQHYQFADAEAATRGPLLYYRLRQVDRDGQRSYSPVRAVSFQQALSPVLAVWPNPTRDTYTVLLTASRSQVAALRVHDILGRQVAELPVQLQTGENRLPASFGPQQPSGVYVLSIQVEGQLLRTRIVRE